MRVLSLCAVVASLSTVIKTGQATPTWGTYVEPMHRSDYRNQVSDCPNCGRRIRLNREGFYRRHFATGPDGCLRLCATSGHAPAEVMPPALRGNE